MEILDRAMTWANTHHKAASLHHKAAFANSVSYLVSGMSGGFGGPSLREHLVSWSLAEERLDRPHPGEWEVEAAITFCEPLCFGPSENYRSTLRQIQESEHSFDDDPTDLAVSREKSV